MLLLLLFFSLRKQIEQNENTTRPLKGAQTTTTNPAILNEYLPAPVWKAERLVPVQDVVDLGELSC